MANKVSTKYVVYKGTSLGLVLLSLALFSAAYDRGAWYHTLEKEVGSGHLNGPSLVQKYNAEQRCIKDERRESESRRKSCPPSLLVIFAISINSVSFLVSGVSLVMSYFANETNQKNIGKIDFILILASGILQFLTAGLILVFIVLIFLSHHSPLECGKGLSEDGQSIRTGAVTVPESAKARHNVDTTTEIRSCGQGVNRLFQWELLVTGMLFASGSGIMLVVTAVLMKAKSRRSRVIRSKSMAKNSEMMMDGNGQQQMSEVPSDVQSDPSYQQVPVVQ